MEDAWHMSPQEWWSVMNIKIKLARRDNPKAPVAWEEKELRDMRRELNEEMAKEALCQTPADKQ